MCSLSKCIYSALSLGHTQGEVLGTQQRRRWILAGIQEGWNLMGSGQWARSSGLHGRRHLVEGSLVTREADTVGDAGRHRERLL